MQETRELHPATRVHLLEIKEKYGFDPTIDEIVWLDSACRNLTELAETDYRELLALPVYVNGDFKLYGLSIAASMWWSQSGSRMFTDQHPLDLYALAFTLAHSRDKDVFPRMHDYRETVRIISDWVERCLVITDDELTYGISQALSQRDRIVLDKMAEHADDEPKDKKATDTWVDYIATLTVSLGTDFASWIWEHSLHTVGLIMKRRAALEGGGKRFDPFDPVNIAAKRIHQVIGHIVKAHQPEANASV